MRGTRTIDYQLGSIPTIKDLREIVEETRGINEESTFKLQVMGGQLEDNYYRLTITEEPLNDGN